MASSEDCPSLRSHPSFATGSVPQAGELPALVFTAEAVDSFTAAFLSAPDLKRPRPTKLHSSSSLHAAFGKPDNSCPEHNAKSGEDKHAQPGDVCAELNSASQPCKRSKTGGLISPGPDERAPDSGMPSKEALESHEHRPSSPVSCVAAMDAEARHDGSGPGEAVSDLVVGTDMLAMVGHKTACADALCISEPDCVESGAARVGEHMVQAKQNTGE